MFAAANAASTLNKHFNDSSSAATTTTTPNCEVHVYEATSKLMSKVLVSGGGRCNVLHDITKPLPKILNSYPRGSRELNGLYSKHFTPNDAFDWFVDRGVVLKTEMDGRMFPITDQSQTIIDCIFGDAIKNGVQVIKGERIVRIEKAKVLDETHSSHDDDDRVSFHVITKKHADGDTHNEQNMEYDCIIMATGSSSTGHEIIKELGHTIVDPIPSLFTLNAAKAQINDDDGVLHDLAGLSVQNAKLTLKVSGEEK
jgi:predicted flavoprotein YhiN